MIVTPVANCANASRNRRSVMAVRGARSVDIGDAGILGGTAKGVKDPRWWSDNSGFLTDGPETGKIIFRAKATRPRYRA
jgi:hypothetical protein